MPGPCKELQQHQWSSGRIHRCHRCDPGSKDTRLMQMHFVMHMCLLHMMANFGNGPSSAVKDGHGGGMCKPCAECGRQEQAWQRVRAAKEMDQKCIGLCGPGGSICLEAMREGVLLKREFAPFWKHPALVGWEEWGKRQTGNGKRKRCQVIVRSMQFDSGTAVLLARKTKRDKSWQHLGLPKRSPTTVLTRPWAV